MIDTSQSHLLGLCQAPPPTPQKNSPEPPPLIRTRAMRGDSPGDYNHQKKYFFLVEKTLEELKAIAEGYKIKSYYQMRKAELVDILREINEEIPDKEPTPEKCPHGRKEYLCKECYGDGICRHKRQRAFCRHCGGSQICQHNIQKAFCLICGGSQLCQHKRRKYDCKICRSDENTICMMDVRKLYEALYAMRDKLSNGEGMRVRKILKIKESEDEERLRRKLLKIEERENDDHKKQLHHDMRRKLRLYNEIKR